MASIRILFLTVSLPIALSRSSQFMYYIGLPNELLACQWIIGLPNQCLACPNIFLLRQRHQIRCSIFSSAESSRHRSQIQPQLLTGIHYCMIMQIRPRPRKLQSIEAHSKKSVMHSQQAYEEALNKHPQQQLHNREQISPWCLGKDSDKRYKPRRKVHEIPFKYSFARITKNT